MEKIWETAVGKQDINLQQQSGGAIYRWYEHQGIYSEARRVLTRLVEIHAERGEIHDEAVCRNNLGFEYLLERRFQEAMVHFDRAAKLFERIGDSGEGANSRSNYWICLFERGEPGDLRRAEEELEVLAETLTHAHFWQARKPLTLLAKISEQRGKLRKAIEFAKRAIQCGTGSGTRYPETDAEYMRGLESRLASCRKIRGRRRCPTGASNQDGATHPRRKAPQPHP
jgi:tetratricopeptide (TPR) repeat protein